MPSILIVDDDQNMASSLQRLLINNDFETAIVGGALEMPTVIDQFQPDLIVMDLQMADGGGQTGIDYIRGLLGDQEMKILVSSGMDLSRLEETLEKGADDFIQKPFESTEFLEKINKLLS